MKNSKADVMEKQNRVRAVITGLTGHFCHKTIHRLLPDIQYDTVSQILRRLKQRGEIENVDPDIGRGLKIFYVKTPLFRDSENMEDNSIGPASQRLQDVILSW